ncbi:MAG: hypothetical protein IKX76_04950 [Eubacterium sp.]|nr:hypothetical protein [Eubacterium sp.]
MSLDSYQLKYIALISMIVDHCGVIFRPVLPKMVYLSMRGVGRLAFPIFSFLLVEGFFHTRDRNRYLARLVLFMVLSEIPFDLALKGTVWTLIHKAPLSAVMDWSGQNVFLTLSLGLAAMMIMDRFGEDNSRVLLTLVAFSCLGEFLHCDYRSTGVITILLFYLIRKYNRLPLVCAWLPLMVLGIYSHVQLFCILSLPLILCYNGKKGRGSRYLFYVAYPGHIIVLLLIRLAQVYLR